MEQIVNELGVAGPKILKFFLQHGLIGTAERVHSRHRHYYLQSFAYNELHGNENSSSISKDFFFVHPSLKEWIRSLKKVLDQKFNCMPVGVIGNTESYESMPPLMCLGILNDQLVIRLGNDKRLTSDRSIKFEHLKLLYIILWGCWQRCTTNLNTQELRDLWVVMKKCLYSRIH